MSEPLDYMDRAELQLNIMRNIEREILRCGKSSILRRWWEMSPNWVRVQAFLNGNTQKAGSMSSGQQSKFIGLDPDSRTLICESNP